MMQAFKHLQGSFLEPTRRRSGQVIFPAIRTSITVSPETFGELCDFCEKHNRRCGFLSVERFTRGSGWKWNIHFLKTMVKNDYHNDQGTKWKKTWAVFNYPEGRVFYWTKTRTCWFIVHIVSLSNMIPALEIRAVGPHNWLLATESCHFLGVPSQQFMSV